MLAFVVFDLVWSCGVIVIALDPVPTTIVKQFLPELLPYLTAMCNTSLQRGCPPESQRRAIITPRLKKPNADPEDVKNYRPTLHLCLQLLSAYSRVPQQTQLLPNSAVSVSKVPLYRN